MCSFRQYAHIVMFFVVAGCLLAIPARANNTTIPWLTGSFGSTQTNYMYALSPDGSLLATIAFFPVVPDIQLSYTGDCNVDPFCYGIGSGPIMTGTVSGDIWDNNNNVQLEGFSGQITGGTATLEQWWQDGSLTVFILTMNYSFTGVWTNQWHTVGSVSTFYSSEGPQDTIASITTNTPEPGTIALLTTGILCGLRRCTKRHLRA
jgi:hypothetical protein